MRGFTGQGGRESGERVRAALTASGLGLPPKRITINLAPADLPKEGSHYDLPIALADVQPLQLEGLVACPHLAAMGVDLADAFCFRVPQVPFRVVSERLL